MLINTNMKVQKSWNLNPFGELNFVVEELDSQKIGTLSNQELPAFGKQGQCSWRALFCYHPSRSHPYFRLTQITGKFYMNFVS